MHGASGVVAYQASQALRETAGMLASFADITEQMRLPLTPCSAAARRAVDEALEIAGLV